MWNKKAKERGDNSREDEVLVWLAREKKRGQGLGRSILREIYLAHVTYLFSSEASHLWMGPLCKRIIFGCMHGSITMQNRALMCRNNDARCTKENDDIDTMQSDFTDENVLYSMCPSL